MKIILYNRKLNWPEGEIVLSVVEALKNNEKYKIHSNYKIKSESEFKVLRIQ